MKIADDLDPCRHLIELYGLSCLLTVTALLSTPLLVKRQLQ